MHFGKSRKLFLKTDLTGSKINRSKTNLYVGKNKKKNTKKYSLAFLVPFDVGLLGVASAFTISAFGIRQRTKQMFPAPFRAYKNALARRLQVIYHTSNWARK
jgi:hypothetical protein